MYTISKQTRLALVTCNALPQIEADDVHFAATLRQLGIIPVATAWNDPAIDWSSFDAVLMRTPWDYFKHYAQFLRWLDALEHAAVTVLNPIPLLRWNSDKRYLLDLARHGVTIVPTQIVRKDELARALASRHGEDVVVKPTVSGGAWHTLRGRAGDAGFDQAVSRLADDLDYMLQPFLAEIVSAGEYSLMFFAGAYNHAVCKRPATADYRVQSEFGGSVENIVPAPGIVAAAQRALDAIAVLGYRDWHYARVDGIERNGDLMIMEIEMIEPRLFFADNAAAAEKFAAQIAARLRQRHATATAQPPRTCVPT